LIERVNERGIPTTKILRAKSGELVAMIKATAWKIIAPRRAREQSAEAIDG
jgi:hypothetical protein